MGKDEGLGASVLEEEQRSCSGPGHQMLIEDMEAPDVGHEMWV